MHLWLYLGFVSIYIVDFGAAASEIPSIAPISSSSSSEDKEAVSIRGEDLENWPLIFMLMTILYLFVRPFPSKHLKTSGNAGIYGPFRDLYLPLRLQIVLAQLVLSVFISAAVKSSDLGLITYTLLSITPFVPLMLLFAIDGAVMHLY